MTQLNPQQQANLILQNPHHLWYWNKWQKYYQQGRYTEIVHEFLTYIKELDAWNAQRPNTILGGDEALKRQLGSLGMMYLN